MGSFGEKYKFKVGDRVKRVGIGEGTVVDIDRVTFSDGDNIHVKWNGRVNVDRANHEINITLVESASSQITKTITKTMKTLTNWVKKTTDTKTQTLIKAGFLNGDLEPTSKGQDALKEIQWFDNLDKLVAAAEEVIKEEESK